MRIWRLGFKRWRGLSLMLMTIIASVLLILTPLRYALAKESQSGTADLSLYQRASELTREFGTSLAPGSGVNANEMSMIYDNDGTTLIPAGNAGAFLGYADVLSDDGAIVGWLTNAFTMGSVTITYEQLKNVVESTWINNPFFLYAGYGEVLTSLGLASTGRGALTATGRAVGSFLTLMVYYLASAAPLLFRGALSLLEFLNPFTLFSGAIDGLSDTTGGLLSPVIDVVSDVYEAIQNFGAAVLLPLLLIMTILGILFFKATNGMKRVARYALRVFMMFAGLPLIGATYTGLIHDLNAQAQIGAQYADYLVLSSYVDFEGWVRHTRLAPLGREFNMRHPASAERSVALSSVSRNMVLAINGWRAGNTIAGKMYDTYCGTSDIGNAFDITDNVHDLDDADIDVTVSTINILKRHMTSDMYTSSDYNGDVVGQIQQILRNHTDDSELDEVEEEILKMFYITSSGNRAVFDRFRGDGYWRKPIDWNLESSDGEEIGARGLFTNESNDGLAEHEVFQFPTYPYNIYNAGDLEYRLGYRSEHVSGRVYTPLAPIGDTKEGVVGGLSPISMYNFLNTSFSKNGLTVYSPERSTSAQTREGYYSVTFAGTGPLVFIRWVENIAIMICMTVLTVSFGLMLVSAALKNIPRILSGVFGTALGSIQYITKLLVSTAVLVIQILGVIFLYFLSESLVMSFIVNMNELLDYTGDFFVAGVIDDFMSGVTLLDYTGNFLGANIITDFASSVILITFTVLIVWQLVKNVKVFTQMMEEVVSGAITRIMGLLDTATGGKGIDLAKATGGRIGADGRLSDEALASDDRGLTGALAGVASGGLVGGVAGVLADAHDIETQREGIAAAEGQTRDVGGKIASRLETAASLMKAKGLDSAKGVVGVDGKSYERAKGLKESELHAMRYHKGTPLAHASSERMGANVNERGQQIDENGELITNEDGDALNALGYAVSPESSAAIIGGKLSTDDSGAVLSEDGTVYVDEAGRTMYADESGALVDEDGQAMMIGDDGVMTETDTPVSALSQIKKFDKARGDYRRYADMKKAQNSSHYGVDDEGVPVDVKGKPIKAVDSEGSRTTASFDNDGYLIGEDGSRIEASNVRGKLDSRAYETVTDDATGKTFVRHKGDQAMRHNVGKNVANRPVKPTTSLQSLAKQAVRAERVANQAEQRVQALKEQGAPAYAIAQAQRFATVARQEAKALEQRAGQEQVKRAQDPQLSQVRHPVSDIEVATATKSAKQQMNHVAEAQAKLDALKGKGAPPAMVAQQQQRVEQAIKQAQQADRTLSIVKLAESTGRAFSEVAQAQSALDASEAGYMQAKRALSEARRNKAPKEVIQQHERALSVATMQLTKAQNDMSHVSLKPQASLATRDMVDSKYTTCLQAERRAADQLSALEQRQAPAFEIARARQNHRVAKRNLMKAKRERRAAHAPKENVVVDMPVVDVKHLPTPAESLATLTKLGVATYPDYARKMQTESSELNTLKQTARQLEQRIQSARKNKMPEQHVERLVKEHEQMTAEVGKKQQDVSLLQRHAHGLVSSGHFKPSVATRPIRRSGDLVLKDMVTLNHEQRIYERLLDQQKKGLLTEQEVRDMQASKRMIDALQRRLVGSGIQQEALRDHHTTSDSVRQVSQTWSSFISGHLS